MVSRNYTRTLGYWIPPVLWAAVILAASSDLFSSAQSGDWLAELTIRLLGHPLPPRTFSILHFLIRKAAHLTEYGILGALCFRALRTGEPGWRVRWAVTAVVLAACVAIADEWHQAYVPSRTASPRDVLLDTVGASLPPLFWRYNRRSS